MELVPITTSGDRHAGSDKSRFVKEIEDALLARDIDLAVHSAKDVPGELPQGLALVGAPAPEDARDALVGAGSLEELREGARVGTSSLRRRSQLLASRADLELVDLRGNVDTRLAKLREEGLDAIVLALAGLRRLGRDAEAGAVLDVEQVVPAPGQGVLALEARAGDERASAVASAISDDGALSRLAAERALVVALEASCHTPIGAFAAVTDGRIQMDAYVGLPDGREWIRDRCEAGRSDPAAAGATLARRLISAGAAELLERGQHYPGLR